ncbi:ankyrin repeat domain-containing protein [Brachyspira murdochii]|uniref:ankyrin repeat domain-containing protein n=1 Tax=Brachyspira murdochii TaxID=84378 RepID=UPI000CEEC28B|nr:ankyrin repeat domain-containing protein [Brachyspira murdochii]
MLVLENGHLEVVKYLLENGANVNLKNITDVSALILASMDNHLEIVKYLLDKGADINAKDNYGKTALMYASEKGHSEVAKFLKSKGAKKYIYNFCSLTIYHNTSIINIQSF